MAELTKVKKSVMEESQVLPDMVGQDGKVLSNNGSMPQWISRQPAVNPDLLIPNMYGQSEKILSNNGAIPIWIAKQTDGRIVGEICRFSFDTPPAGFFALDGSTIVNGKIDFPDLANCGSRFITIIENNLILADCPDFGRGKGSSGRSVGSFEGDAIRNITGTSYIFHAQYLGIWGGQIGAIQSIASDPGVSSVLEGTSDRGSFFNFDASRVVPTAPENRPKSLTELVCIYHGVI